MHVVGGRKHQPRPVIFWERLPGRREANYTTGPAIIWVIFDDYTLPIAIYLTSRALLEDASSTHTSIACRAYSSTGSAVIGIITEVNTFTIAIYLASGTLLEDALSTHTGIASRAYCSTGSTVIGVITEVNTFTFAFYLTSRTGNLS